MKVVLVALSLLAVGIVATPTGAAVCTVSVDPAAPGFECDPASGATCVRVDYGIGWTQECVRLD